MACSIVDKYNLILLADIATNYAHPEIIKKTLIEFIHRMYILIEKSYDPKKTYMKMTLSNMLYILGVVPTNYLQIKPSIHTCREVIFNMTLWLVEMKKNVQQSPEYIFMFNEMSEFVVRLHDNYK